MKVSKSRGNRNKTLGKRQLGVKASCAGAVIATTLTGLAPVVATAQERLVIEEVVVNARRREESAQDVSQSMSVFNQKQLDEANITNPGDLATYTPSLQANNRFGGDNTTFAIRGFSQELRTTASVAVYFAEVVAPRGANAQQSGDGASPGDMFDLASVQVLKGPQGTLFGRNTTGGAVLLVPQKPTDVFEGYVEVTHGNYDLWREQAVINVPITDNFAVRLGVDHQERDGYLNNISDVGPDDFADSKYTSVRLSMLWDITDSVENYTILKHTESDNNGFPGSLLTCGEAGGGSLGFGPQCRADLARREASGDDGFYDVFNSVPEPVNEQEISQIINTTSWQINDELLFKNITAFTTLETRQRSSLFGENFFISGQKTIFQQVGLAEDLPTTDQETLVEEIQLQGNNFDGAVTWVLGLYYENSEPGEDSGAQSPAIIACDQESITSSDPFDFRCSQTAALGSVARLEGGVEYNNQAAYFQSTIQMNEFVSVDLGLRYTRDETEGYVTETVYTDFFGATLPVIPPGFPPLPPKSAPYGPIFYPLIGEPTVTERNPKTTSEAPTWLMGLNIMPNENTLLYAKYVRGYRQGSVNIAGAGEYIDSNGDKQRADIHDPEKVDTYEIGSKNQFELASLPVTFNIAAFYNDFTDQQIQYGYFAAGTNVGTTAVTNAGSSSIWGVEADGNILLPGNVIFNYSYSHLDTEVKQLDPIDLGTAASSVVAPSVTTAEGEPLSLVPKNQFVGSLAWILPTPVEWGDMKAAVTYVFTDEQQGVGKDYSALAVFPQYELWNFNLSWNGIMGTGLDVSAFMTNAKDEEYITYIAGTYANGLESGAVGQPRMYGMRVKYNFGSF